MRTEHKLKDSQRESFKVLINDKLPNLISGFSQNLLDDKYLLDLKLFPIDVKDIKSYEGTDFYVVKAECKLVNLTTKADISFNVDLLYLPAFQELGFKVGGNFIQMLDAYERVNGWNFSLKENKKSEQPTIKASALGKYGKTFTFLYDSKKNPVVSFKTTSQTEKGSVEVGHFFKALTGESYVELLERFGHNNPYVIQAFSKYEPSRDECIKKLVVAMLGIEKAESLSSTNLKLREINNQLFSSYGLDLGKHNHTNFDGIQSFKRRALTKVLAKSITLNNEILEAGTVLTAEILEKLDAMPISSIDIKYENKQYQLKKFSTFTFRAYGWILAQDIPELDLRIGKKLDLQDLEKLNRSNLENLRVKERKDSAVIEIHRRISAQTLHIEDLYTACSIWFDNLNGLDVFDNPYELTNRICVPYDTIVCDMVSQHVNSVINTITKNLEMISSDDSLLSGISDFAANIDLNRFINRLRDTNDNGQMAEMCNIVAFASKSNKISTDIKMDNVTPEMVSVQDTQEGRLDPYDVPESAKIGVVHNKTLLTKLDEAGNLTSPYLKVINGEVVTGEPEYLTALEEAGKNIAAWDETFLDENGNKKEHVRVRCDGSIISVTIDKVNYIEYSPVQSMSIAHSYVTFPGHSNGKRITMSCNQQRQALPTVKSCRPKVGTGCESLVDLGNFKAKSILLDYYNTKLITFPEIATYKEEILSSTLTLLSIQKQHESRVLTFSVNAIKELGLDDKIDYKAFLTIIYNLRNYQESIFTYKINHKADKTYFPDDIVAYNSGYSLEKYEREDLIDMGKMPIDTNKFDSGLALGNDYIVAYKTCESSNIDDALVISDRLIFDDELTHIRLVQIKDTLYSDAKHKEVFGVSGNNKESYFDFRGLPKVGTQLNPGDKIVSKITIGKNGNQSVKYTYLSAHVKGQVVAAYIDTKKGDSTAIVWIAERAAVQVGDKLSGRHGNKGVIAKILPQEEMPWDAKTGRTVDIILNPLGVPSRQNVSQLLEDALGLCRLIDGKQSYVSPYHKDDLKFVKEQVELFNVHPTMLIDGRTGEQFKRPVNIGVLHMYKLQHIADGKIHAIGLDASVDPVFLQPRKGSKRNGGQSFGEMENWCLQGVGATKVLQDLHTLQSDDYHAREDLKTDIASYGGDTPPSLDRGVNSNDAGFQAMIRSLGAELVADKENNSYELVPLTDDVIRGFSSVPVETKYDLHSSTIFGHYQSAKQKTDARHKWGYIELNTKIVHPMWLCRGQLSKYITLQKSEDDLGSFSTKLAEGMINGKIYVSPKESNDVCFRIYGDIPGSGISSLEEVSEELKDSLITGMSAVVYCYENVDLAKKLRNLEAGLDAKIKRDKENGKYDPDKESYISYVSYINMLRAFVQSGNTAKDYVISTIPVMPQNFRPLIENSVIKNGVADFDHHYEQIINAAKKVKENCSDKNVASLYNRLKDFTGIDTTIKVKDKKYQDILSYFVGKDADGKHGKIRSAMQSKRIFCSGRAVITPASMDVKPTELGVPITMLTKMYKEFLKAYITKELNATQTLSDSIWKKILLLVSLDDSFQFKKYYSNSDTLNSFFGGMNADSAYSKIKSLTKEYFLRSNDDPQERNFNRPVVLSGRQPSLHKYSIRAFYVVPLWSKAIQINSLVCKGYNADFDGDMMYVVAMLTQEAREEAIEKLSPSIDFINPKNGAIMLEHSQDIVLGCYCATMLQDNALKYNRTIEDAHYYSSLELLRADVHNGIIEPHDLVCFALMIDNNVNHYLGTAGRILFNAIFEDGFTEDEFTNSLNIANIQASRYKNLKYDGIITSSSEGNNPIQYYSLQKICKDLYLDYGSDCLDIYYDIQTFGFLMSDLFGVSISIEDMDIKSCKEELLKEADSKRALLEEDYQNGLIADDDKRDAIIALYSDSEIGVNTKIEKDLIKNLPRNNNLFIMMDSGARGNKTQIMHMCGAIGVLEKDKTQSMEDSITQNYYEGLDSFGAHMASYSSRTGVASTQRETRQAGYATRKVIYMTTGFKITAEDCGKERWWYDIKWDDIRPELSRFKPSKKWFDEHLLGREIVHGSAKDLGIEDKVIEEIDFNKFYTKGFNTICLRTETDVETLKADPYLLKGAKLTEKESSNNQKLFKYLLNKGYLDGECIRAFDRYKVKHIETNYGTLECRYKIHSACRSQLEFREARNLEYLSKTLDKTYNKEIFTISTKTLDWIEEQGIDTIEARVMLDCECEHGTCAHCYGLKYSDLQLPKIGEVVGTEAAQSIGEPAAQLTMNVINKGGVAGASIASGIDVFTAYLNGTAIGGKNARVAETAPNSGYVKLLKQDNSVGILVRPQDLSNPKCQECLEKFKTDCCPFETNNQLSVSNDPVCLLDDRVEQSMIDVLENQWVDSGVPLTSYPAISNNITSYKDSSEPDILLRYKQMVWILNYYSVFKNQGIMIYVRHFETLVKLQNSYAVVTESNNPEFLVGEVYETNQLLKADDSVHFKMSTAPMKQVILRSSGLLTALTFAEQLTTISTTTTLNFKSDNKHHNSPIGKIAVGQKLDSESVKELHTAKFNPVVKEKVEEFVYTPQFVELQNEQNNIIDSFSKSIFNDMASFDLDELSSPSSELGEEAVSSDTAEMSSFDLSKDLNLELGVENNYNAADNTAIEQVSEISTVLPDTFSDDDEQLNYTVEYYVNGSLYNSETKVGEYGDIIAPDESKIPPDAKNLNNNDLNSLTKNGAVIRFNYFLNDTKSMSLF